MNITEILIRRPVLATVINIMVVLLGVVSFNNLTVREYPNIDVPTVTVTTDYRGAPAAVIESQVTKPLEDALSGIEGIDFVKSISRSEQSQITISFRLSRDPDAAASDVRDRVSRTRKALPDEIDEPIVAKVEADAQPIIWLSLSSTKQTLMEVSDYADRVVVDRLQTLPGVSQVRIFGERRPSMRIWLDPNRMAAYGVTTQDVEDTLTAQNVDIPAGRIESTTREFTVRNFSDANTIEDFRNLIVTKRDSHLVRISDIAKVEIAPEEERSFTRFNGVNTIGLGIIKQSTANPLEVSDGLVQAIPELQKNMPEGMKLNTAYNSSVFIKASIESVYHTIGEAIILVAVVIYLFLGSLRATLIPLVTIPISLIGSFAMMSLFGFSINTLTLLSLVLAIGLVVDDAIVVLENIFRHIEEGMKPLRAAINGIKEIAFAVIAMTLTLAAVFAPLAFASGRTGKLFTEFALTLAGAVVISGFIALTLSPMMCSLLLRREKKSTNRLRVWIDTAFDRLNTSYNNGLAWSLARRPLIVAIAVIAAVGMVIAGMVMKSELSPTEDRGVFFVVMNAPEGSTPQYLDGYARQVEEVVKTVPELAWRFVAVGFPISTQAMSPVGLKPWGDRDRKQMEIVQSVFPRLLGIPGIMAFAINPPSLGQGSRSQPIELIIQTSGTYEDLNTMVGEIMAKASQGSVLVNVDSDLKLNKPELRVNIDRDKMADLGIGVDTLGRTLETMLGSRQVTRYKDGGDQYDVLVQIEEDLRRSPQDLTAISLRSADGEMVQLSNLVTLEEGVAPRELNHFNKLRAATITASLAPGATLGDGLTYLEAIAREVGQDKIQIDYGGQSREFRESGSEIIFVFLLALGFIYLVLAAQFESFISPVTIMLSVPLAMLGALLALHATGGTLNLYSQIGLLTLVGLITKHGIMLVEFANEQRVHGKDKFEAIKAACMLRFRPILMTTAATVLGAVPLALASGAGAESRQQIGWVIVGGMTLGTLLTLFVVPTIYTYLTRKDVTHDEDNDTPAPAPAHAITAERTPVTVTMPAKRNPKGGRA